MDVVEHYAKGGVVKTNLSPDVKELKLTEQDKKDLVAFLQALTSEHEAFVLPRVPVGIITVKTKSTGDESDNQSVAKAD